jgi:hypothetical protein
LERDAFLAVGTVLRKSGLVKSFHLIKVIDLASLCRLDSHPAHQQIWSVLEDQLLFSAEYETLRDIVEVLETVRTIPHF